LVKLFKHILEVIVFGFTVRLLAIKAIIGTVR